MPTLEEIKIVVRNIRERKRKWWQERVDQGHIPPHYDLQDFTDKNFIFGMKISRVFNYDHVKDPEDLENFNLGSLLTYDNTNVPFYKFARLKGLIDEYYRLHDECDMGELHVKNQTLENAIGPIFNVLTDNEMFRNKILGPKKGCHVTIFIYPGREYRSKLKLLATKFRERDMKITTALSNYYNEKLVGACDRILATSND